MHKSWCVYLRRYTIRLRLTLRNLTDTILDAIALGPRIITRILAKVRWLIHIDPQSINVYTSLCIKKAGKLVIPVTLGIRVKPIGKRSHTGPDSTLVDTSVGLFEKDIGFYAVVVGIVILGCDSCKELV